MIIRELGRTGIPVSAIGLGCRPFVGRGPISATVFGSISQDQVDLAVNAALAAGITWFDTAESYGRGASERSLSAALTRAGIKPGDVTVATKWAPWARTAKSIERTLDDRLDALDPFPVDVHQIQRPYGSFSSIRTQLRTMARLAAAHEIGTIGVSNFSARQMQIAHAELAHHGIALASNQIQINLLHRTIETNGALDTARRLGITLIAYSPLHNGILTGKFHHDRNRTAHLPIPRRKLFSNHILDRTTPVIDALSDIAAAHCATPTQIALAWLLAHYGNTVIATPGATHPHHATEAANATNITLNHHETQQLTDLSTQTTT